MSSKEVTNKNILISSAVLPDGNGGFTSRYELMTEAELIEFLRIPEISKATDFHNVIEQLKRYRDLPRIYICNTAMYPKKAIMEWIEKETSK